MMKTRLATPNDVEDILSVILESSNFLKQNQIPQWQGINCPNRELIEHDILHGFGHILEIDGNIAGYASFSDVIENVYDDLFQSLNFFSDRYIVIHRIASRDKIRGKGYMSTFLKQVMDQLSSKVKDFRIDTHPKNIFMQKVINHLGFTYIGDVNFPITDGIRHTYRLLY